MKRDEQKIRAEHLELSKNVHGLGSSHHGSAVNPTRIHEDSGSIPDLAQWVKDPALRELWCRSQTRLRSGVAVAVV